MKVAFFTSGGGSNLEAILQKIEEKKLLIKPAFILSNNSDSRALKLAKQYQIKGIHCSDKTQAPEKTTQTILSLLVKYQVDLIVLAGYMKNIPSEIIQKYPNRILNIHPSLLPAFGGKNFYGEKIHQAVIHRQCQYTGITIHFVTENYDEGRILFQKVISVSPQDTPKSLGNKVLKIEHDSYWRVIQDISKT